MIRFLTSCCVACVAMTSVAQAQFFGFGPWGGVRIRAPFVAVDVAPYGGTRVIAPFTAVDTRYYGYGPVYGPVVPVPPYPVPVYPAPVYRTPVYPTPMYPTPMYPTPVYPGIGQVVPESSDYRVARPAITGSVAEQLRASAERLARSLSMRRDDSDVWLRYLDPQRIIEVVDRGESPESLRGLVANYDGVVGNAGLVTVRNASGFLETRQWLHEYVNRPPQQPAGAADSAPVPAPDDRADEPTPAPPVQPAVEDEEKAEELLPVPPPPQPAVPVPPQPSPV